MEKSDKHTEFSPISGVSTGSSAVDIFTRLYHTLIDEQLQKLYIYSESNVDFNKLYLQTAGKYLCITKQFDSTSFYNGSSRESMLFLTNGCQFGAIIIYACVNTPAISEL